MNMNFRSALGGFNKEDVAHYLEYLNSQHAAQVNQLNIELDNLRKKLANHEAARAVGQENSTPRVQELESRNRDLEQRNRDLEAQLRQVIAQRDQALGQLEVQAAKSVIPAVPAQGSQTQELEAYRRAERAERLAQERAEAIGAQSRVLLEGLSSQLEATARQMAGISQQVNTQLEGLRAAMASGQTALQNAARTMETLKGKQE